MEKLANSFAKFDFEKTCFIDESSLNLAYTRLYGWAEANQRVREGLADVCFMRQSIVSTIRLDGSQVPLVFEGTLNGVLLVGYVRNCLVPRLGVDDVVVWDSGAVYKLKFVVLALKVCGVGVVCFSLYLPGFNPFVLLWVYLRAGFAEVKGSNCGYFGYCYTFCFVKCFGRSNCRMG